MVLSKPPVTQGIEQNPCTACNCGFTSEAPIYFSCPVQTFIAVYIHTPPLIIRGDVGGTFSSNAPSQQWSKSVNEVIDCMVSLLTEVVGNLGRSFVSPKHNTMNSSVFIENWLRLWKDKDPCEIAENFVWLFEAMAETLSLLIARDEETYIGVDGKVPLFMDARLDVTRVLDLVDSLLSLPMTTEAVYLSTKKRLRHEVPDSGGLLTAFLVPSIANPVQLAGYQILESVCQLGEGVLLPLGRRMLRIAHAGLMTTCPSAVRRACDASFTTSTSRYRWLNASVSVRQKAVEAVALALSRFGCDPLQEGMCNSDVEKSLQLVCGCLVEQQRDDDPGTWGSLEERALFVCALCDCLSCALCSGGAYLSLNIRGLIDSVAQFYLESNHPLCSFCEVQRCALNLVTRCIQVPWQDGATNSLRGDLANTVRQALHDGSFISWSQGRECLVACEASAVSRVPALNVVSTRSVDQTPSWSMEELKQNLSALLERERPLEVASVCSERHELDSIHENLQQSRNGVDRSVNEKRGEIPPAAEHNGKDRESKPSCQGIDTVSPSKEDNARLGSSTLKAKVPLTERTEAVASKSGMLPLTKESSGDDDDDLPLIVDCGPDEEDT